MKSINIKSTFLLLIVIIIFGNPSNSVSAQNLESKIDSLLVKLIQR